VVGDHRPDGEGAQAVKGRAVSETGSGAFLYRPIMADGYRGGGVGASRSGCEDDPVTTPAYARDFAHVAMRRDGGILELRLHTDGGPLVWGAGPHSELGRCFQVVGSDPENRVIVLTGTGDSFIRALDDSWVGPMTSEKWQRIFTDGRRLLTALLDVEVPVVAAVNGPASVHAELALLSDIVIAADTTYFQDAPHFRYGTVPGDGVQVVWPLLLGPNRGRFFLLTGERIPADEAKALGIVAEVVPHADVVERAWHWARELSRQADVTLRYTRAALTQSLKRAVLDQVPFGLALEGLAAHETWPTQEGRSP
jgi:enoyl-CoA hydratase/carnithine racemase